jgi:hypothetical protein
MLGIRPRRATPRPPCQGTRWVKELDLAYTTEATTQQFYPRVGPRWVVTLSFLRLPHFSGCRFCDRDDREVPLHLTRLKAFEALTGRLVPP